MWMNIKRACGSADLFSDSVHKPLKNTLCCLCGGGNVTQSATYHCDGTLEEQLYLDQWLCCECEL